MIIFWLCPTAALGHAFALSLLHRVTVSARKTRSMAAGAFPTGNLGEILAKHSLAVFLSLWLLIGDFQ